MHKYSEEMQRRSGWLGYESISGGGTRFTGIDGDTVDFDADGNKID